MAAIINGPNGKYVLATINFLGISTILLCAYCIQQGYSPSISYDNMRFAFSKTDSVAK